MVSDVSRVARYVRTSTLSEDLILLTPHTSAHQAFTKYLEAARPAAGRRRRNKRNKKDWQAEDNSISNHSVADEMPIVIQLAPGDVANIKASWSSIECQLLQVGIRVFLVLFETQPNNLKRTFRQFRGKRHSELRINEDLQRHILYLMCCLKRVVRYISDTKAMAKYLRRMAKKHSPTDVDFSRIDSAEVAAVFCNAVRELLPRQEQVATSWNTDVEASWVSLFCAVLGALRCLMAPTHRDASCGGSGSECGDGGGGSDCSTSSSSLMPPMTSFDRHLVLVGCQTFQAFFDRHPQVLSHFDKFNAIEIDGVRVSSALKMHSSRVLAIVEDIVDNTGNPDKIRTLMQDLGRHHYRQGITQEHLDMLGPLICHTIRPLVFRAGLWTIELEKSWSHLFDMVAMLMKRGYPHHHTGDTTMPNPNAAPPGIFPTLTHTLILKDTWAVIVEQMHELGLSTFIKLFRLSANLRYYYPKHNRPESPDVQLSMNEHFDQLVAVVDDVVRSLPDLSTHVQFLRNLGAMHCDVDIEQRLLELMGPVFCNTVRPLLLVQGRWSYQVEMAWLLLFRHIAGFMRSGYKSVASPLSMHSREMSTSSKSL